MSKIGVVIPAAGSGSRMGAKVNKQFLKLLEKPILYHTIKKFLAWKTNLEINIILAADEVEYFKENVEKLFSQKKLNFNLIAGGKSRQESVYNGLINFSKDVEYVIIHDGARPLLKKETIERTYQAVKKYDAVSCGVEVKDTIKVVENSFVKETLKRDKLRAIQTPQAFKLELLKKAHKKDRYEQALDDASLVENLGKKVYIVKGDYDNFKITTPEDIRPAEIILKERI